MAIMPMDATSKVVTEPVVANTLTDNIIDAFKAPFMTQGTEVMDADGAFWNTVTSACAGAIGGGMFARKRADAGKAPILKFLF